MIEYSRLIWQRMRQWPFVCVMLMLSLFTATSADAQANRYWVGDPGENFGDPIYWSASSGNACNTGGGASVPGAGDIIHFTDTCTNSVSLNVDLSAAGIVIDEFYSGTITLEDGVTLTVGSAGWMQSFGTFSQGDSGANVDINGPFNIQAGTFARGAGSNLNVSGTFTIGSDAAYTASVTSGTLTLDGDLYFGDNTIPLQNLGRLAVGSSPDTTTLTSDLLATSLVIDAGDALITDGYNVTITGTIDINGTLDAAPGPGGNTTVFAGGLWDMTGGMFVNTSSTVVFSGTSAVQTFDIISDSKSFNNVKFDDNGGGTTWELEDAFVVNGTFELVSGTFDTNAVEDNPLTSTGTLRIQGGSFEARGSTITLSNDFLSPVGSAFDYGTSVIDMIGSGDIEVATSGVYAIKVAALGQTNEIINNDLYTHDIITIGPGTLDGLRVRLDRDAGVPMILDPAATLSNSGFVYQDGTDTVVGADYQGPLFFRVSAETYVLNGNVVATNMNIADLNSSGTATVDTSVNDYSITLSGNLDIGDGSGSRIGHLILNDSTLTIGGNVRFRSAGGWQNTLEGDQAQIFVGGDWDASFGSTLNLGTSTVTFNANAGTSVVTMATTGTIGQFANVVVDDGDGGSDLIVQVSGRMNVGGTLRVEDGSLDVNGYELHVDGNVDINDELDASAGAGGNSSVYVGGSWDASGGAFTSTNSTVVFAGTTTGLTITSDSKSFNNFTLNGTNGMLAYWKLDELLSPSMDATGNGYLGTWGGGVNQSSTVNALTAFNNPGSAEFDGSTDYIDFGDINEFDLTESFTITLWVQVLDLGSDQVLISKDTFIGDASLLIWRDESAFTSGRADTVTFLVTDTDGTSARMEGSVGITNTSSWIHLAFTFEANSANGLRLYVNGVEDSFSPVSSVGISHVKATNQGIRIGADQGGARSLNGRMDEVRVYLRALSASEIARIAAGNMPGTGLGVYTLQDNLDINGTLTLNDGTLNTGADRQINLAGSWMNNGGIFVENSGLVEFDGTGTEKLILNGSHTFNNVDIAGSGTWTLQDNMGVNIFDLSAGTLSPATSTVIEPISVNGATTLTGGTFSGQSTDFRHGGDLTISSGTYTAPTGDLLLDADFTFSAGTFSHSSSTVIFSGTSSTSLVDASGTSFNNVVIDDSDNGADLLVQLSSAMDVNGSLQITDGTFDVNAGAFGVNVAGNWTLDAVNGTFIPRTGTVTFDGVNQSISGSTTFYHFNKVEVNDGADSTLTFGGGETFIVQGSLTLDGADTDDRINLVSSIPSTRFNISVTGTPTVDYVMVTDSEALGTDIIAGDSIDGGNTDSDEGSPEWFFGVTADVSGSTNLGDGTLLRIAVDGRLLDQNTTTAAGAWTISNAVLKTDRPLVVWADGVADINETTAVTLYDGIGNVTGMVLTTGSLSIGSDDLVNVDMTDLQLYDFDDDEDIMFTANSGTLDIQGGNTYTDETLNILTNNTLTLDSGWDLVTEELIINGTLNVTGTNVIQLNDGDWQNNGAFIAASSTVFATSNAAISIGGATTFYGLTVNNTGCSTTTISANMVIRNDLDITTAGTGCGNTVLAAGANSYSLMLWGDATVADGGAGAGGGLEDALIVDMTGTLAQTITNINDGYIGGLTISNTTSTVSLSSDLDVRGTLTIASGAVLDATISNYDLTLSGGSFDWVNNGLFVEQMSTVEFIPHSTGDMVIFGVTTFYNMYVNSTLAGNLVVSDNQVIGNDLTINLTNASSGLNADSTDTHSLSVSGNVVNSSTADIENDLTIVMQGTSAQTIAQTGSGDFGDIQISNTFNDVLMVGDLNINDDITVDAGAAFDLDDSNVTTLGATAFVVSGTLRLDGDQTFVAAQPSFTGGAWIEFTATGGTVMVQDWAYENIKVNGAGATFDMQSNESIGQFLLVGGTFDTTGSNYQLTTNGSFRIQGGNFTANSSVITLNDDLYIANTSGLFSRGTSNVVLNASSNISNANSGNSFHDVTQQDGITTTLIGNMAIGGTGEFNTGNATSTIRTDGNSRTVQFYDTSTITNNGMIWNAQSFSGDLRVDFYGGSRTTGNGNYGNTPIRFFLDDGATFTLDGSIRLGDFSIGALAAADSNTFDTAGYQFASRDFDLGTSGQTDRYSTFNAQSSTVLISRDVTFRTSDSSGDNIFNAQTSYVNVGDDWTNNGVFNAGTSTVNFDGNAIMFDGSTTFYNWIVVENSNDFLDPQLTITAGDTIVIQGTLVMMGLDVNDRVTLRSSVPGSRWNIAISSGQGNVDFIDVSDSEVIGSNDIFGTNSLDTSNNDSGEGTPHWIFALSGTIDISGSSDLPPGTTIRVAATGSFQNLPATTTAGDGSWTISGVPGLATDEIIHVWAEGVAEALEATSVTLYDGTGNITGMVLNSNVLIIGSDDNSVVSVTDLAEFDNDDDEDLIFVSNIGTLVMDPGDVYSDEEIRILANNTLRMTNNQNTFARDITINGVFDINGTAGVRITDGDWVNNGTFDPATSSVLFTSTSGVGSTISGDNTFYNLTTLGSGTTTVSTGTIIVDDVLYVTSGTLDMNDNSFSINGSLNLLGGQILTGTAPVTIGDAGGDFVIVSDGTLRIESDATDTDITINAGAWTNSGGAVEYTGSSSTSVFSAIQPYYDLVVNSAGNTFTANTDITVNNDLKIQQGTLDLDGYELTVDGSVDLDGTLDASTGTDGDVTIDVGAAWDSTGGTFTNTNSKVDFTGTTATQTYTLTSGSVIFNDIEFVNPSATTTWVLEDSLDVNGNVRLAGGTLDVNVSENNSINFVGNWTVTSGQFEPRAGTVVFDRTSGSAAMTTNGQALYNLQLNDGGGPGDGRLQLADTLRLTGSLSLDNGTLDLVGQDMHVGGHIDINDTLDAAPDTGGNSTIYGGGDWDMTGGVFSGSSSTVIMTGTTAGLTITADSKTFNNFMINDGLVGYWKFEETSSPAIDSSGYTSHAVWTNGAGNLSNTPSLSKYENLWSMNFDGDNDYLELGTINSDHPLMLFNTEFTISAWFYQHGGGDDFQRIVDKSDNGNAVNGYALYVRPDSQQAAIMVNDNSYSTTSTENYALNTWNHIAAVVTNSDSAIYINGVEITTSSYTRGAHALPPNVNTTMRIGSWNHSTQREYDGELDEIRIYNRALTAAEIARMANGYMPGVGGGTYTLQDALNVDGSLTINAGELDSGANQNINVAGSWINNGGIFTPNLNLTTLDGTGSGLEILSGTQTFYNLHLANAGTWTLLDDLPVSSELQVRGNGSLGYSTDTNIEPISIIGDTLLPGGGPTGTFIGNANQFRHDGDLHISAGTYTAPTDLLEITGSFIHSGGTFNNSSSTVIFGGTTGGLIDSSGGAVFNDLVISDGLVAYWKMDEIVTPTFDHSGYGNHCTWVNSPTTSNQTPDVDYVNPASLEFDQADTDHLDCGSDESLNLTEAITVTAWVNPGTPLNAETIIVTRANSTGSTTDWRFMAQGYTAGGGEWGFRVSPLVTESNANTALSSGTWYHLAVTYDRQTVRLYLNGVPDGTSSKTAALGATQPIKIGRGIGGAQEHYDGLIDEVRIYNRVLSATEITRLAAGTLPQASTNEYTLQTDLDVDDDIYIHTGELDTGSDRAINVGGSWINNGGRFVSNNGTVLFDGTSSGNSIVTRSQTFYQAEISGVGEWQFEDNVYVSQSFVVSTGSLTYSSADNLEPITLNGTLNVNGGLFNGTSTRFRNVGQLNISAGTFNAPTDVLEIDGTFTHSGGTFNTNSSTVMFVGTTTNAINMPSGAAFNDVMINDGLIGYWSMDDLADPSQDYSGYGNHAAWEDGPANATNVAPLNFVNPRSILLDGTNDVLNTGMSENLQEGDFSVSLWIRPDTLSQIGRLVADDDNGLGWALSYGDGGDQSVRFFVRGMDVSTLTASSVISSSARWYHVAGVFDNANNERLIYVNGIQVAADLTDTGTPTVDPGNIIIGGESSLSPENREFDGRLDDVRIYRRVLTPLEIQRLAKGDMPRTAIGQTTLQTAVDIDGDLVIAAGEFNVGSDYAVNLAGSWINYGGSFEPGNGTVTFDGTTTGHIILSGSETFTNADLAGTGEWSLNDDVATTSSFDVSSGTLTYSNDDDVPTITSYGTLLINGGTFIGTSARFRSDGILSIESGVFTAPSDVLEISGTFSHSGGTFNTNSSTVMFVGDSNNTIDLTAGTAFNDLAINDGLVGYWRMDETSSPVQDSSGYANNGTWSGTTTSFASTASTIQFSNPGAVSFDGSGDYIFVPENNLYNSENLTVSYWLRIPSGHGNVNFDRIFELGGYLKVGGISMEFNGTTQLTAYVWNTPTWTDIGSYTFVQDEWFNVILTSQTSPSQQHRIYINGVEQGSGTTQPRFVSPESLTIGARNNNNSQFQGEFIIDDFRIYNRVLSPSEITRISSGAAPALSQSSTTLLTNLDVDGNIIISSGTLDVGSNRLINVAGSWLNQGGVFNEGTSTVIFDAQSGTVNIQELQTFYHVQFNDAPGGTAIFNQYSSLDIDGNLSLTDGTLDASTDNHSIQLAGNWINNDTFTPRTGTVEFDGDNQTVTGATTFYSIAKYDETDNGVDSIIAFEAGTTFTINGTITFQGLDDSDRVNIVSTNPGTRSTFDVAIGNQRVRWMDIQDSQTVTSDLLAVRSIENTNTDAPEASPHWIISLGEIYEWTGSSDATTWEDQGNWSVRDSSDGDDGYPDDNLEEAFFLTGSNTIDTPSGTLTIGGLQTSGAFTGTVVLSGTLVLDDAAGLNGDVNILTGTLTHLDNTTTETNKLVMQIDGDLTVAAGAQINVDGLGYDAGFGPGTPGAGINEGGSYGGQGGDHNLAGIVGSVYGSITAPVNIGSGGGTDASGGGAAIITVGGTTTIDGSISAQGDAVSVGAGSGGTINLTTGYLQGTGTLSVDGGSLGIVTRGAGGGGRIAVDLTGAGADFMSFTGTMRAYGGDAEGRDSGAAGTIYWESPSVLSGQGTLIIDNNNNDMIVTGTILTLMPTSVNLNDFAAVVVRNHGNLGIDADDTINFGTVNLVTDDKRTAFVSILDDTGVTFPAPFTLTGYTLNADGVSSVTGDWTITNGILSHSRNTQNHLYDLNLTITGALNVASTGEINVDGMGYYPSYGPGAPSTTTNGGAYGGIGGDHNEDDDQDAQTYGSITAPIDLGSGSGSAASPYAGSGGGAAILTVTGITTIDGTFSAQGAVGGAGGSGSGGSIFLTTDSLAGTGTIIADGGGGGGGVSTRGNGGGGRVALVLTGGGSDFNTFETGGTITAYGGTGLFNFDGAAGTIYKQTSGQGSGNGILIIDNNGNTNPYTAGGVVTTLDDQDANMTVVGSLVIQNEGYFVIGADDMLTVGGTNDTFTVTSGASFVNFGTFVLAGDAFTTMGSQNYSNTGNTVILIGEDDDSGSPILSGGTFYNLILNNAGNQFTAYNNVDVNGTFRLQAGEFNQNERDLNVAGNFILDAGTSFIKSNIGTLTLDGDLYYADYTDPLQDVGRLVIGQSPDTTTLLTDMSATSLKVMATDFLITDGYNIYLTGTMDINGDLNAAAGAGGNTDIHVGGPWDATGGNFTATDTTVMFVGTTSALTITSSGESFNNLIINSSIGLVGYWKLDESASPALDYSGYGHHGTWFNDVSSYAGTSTVIRYNNPGAAEFDGTNDYIEIPDSDVLDQEDDTMTVMAWINPHDFGEANQGRIIDHGGGDGFDGGWAFRVDDSGPMDNALVFIVENDAGNRDFVQSNNEIITLNEWQHVAATINGFNVEFFVNGVSEGTAVLTRDIGKTTEPVRIGIRASDTNRDYDGYIDEVRIYGRVLADAEIQDIANGTMPLTGLGTYTLQDNLDVNGTLSLNDGTLDTGSNRQINVARSWLNHGGQFMPNSGVVIFDGGVTGNQILSGSETFRSVSIVGFNGGWELQDDTAATGGYTIALGDLSYATSTVIEPVVMNSNMFINAPFGTFTGTSTRFRHAGDVNISDGTYTAPTDVVEIDGSFTHTGGTFTNSSSTVMFTGTGAGSTINTSGGGTFQNVIVNDGLIAYWPLDEVATPSLDYSGYDNHLDWVNAPTSTNNTTSTIKFRNPSSLQFDGGNDVLAVTDYNINKRLDIEAGEEFTMSVWVRSSDTTQDQKVIDNRDGNVGGYQLRFTTGGGFFLRIDEGPGSTDTVATPTVMDGTWKHIAAGRSSAEHFLYVNGGTPDTSADATLADLSNSIDFQLGGESAGAGAWNGEIDDVRIYNRALSAAEIQRLANGDQPSTGLGTYTLASNLDVDGTLRLNAGTLDTDAAANYQVNVGGDWENFGGVFNARSGTVVFDGNDHWIPASETFYNFSKNLTAGPSRTLTFGRKSTVTVNNTLDIGGFDASNELLLRSSSVGARFNVDVTGAAQTVRFVNVQDSEALSNDIKTLNSTDAGNTDTKEGSPRWVFGPLRGAIIIVD